MDDANLIETPRLILRRMSVDDAPALLEMLSDERVSKFLPLFAPADEKEARSFIDRTFLSSYARADAGERGADGCPLDLKFAVCLKDAAGAPARLIGYIQIDGDEAHDFGYAYVHDAWGHGYASEAARAMVARARAEGLPFLTATHDELNPASGHVMRASGMDYRYSYREHWMPKDYEVVFRMYQIDIAKDASTYRGYWERYPEHWVDSPTDGAA